MRRPACQLYVGTAAFDVATRCTRSAGCKCCNVLVNIDRVVQGCADLNIKIGFDPAADSIRIRSIKIEFDPNSALELVLTLVNSFFTHLRYQQCRCTKM